MILVLCFMFIGFVLVACGTLRSIAEEQVVDLPVIEYIEVEDV